MKHFIENFYFSDLRFHAHAFKSLINPLESGYYVNFHAHKRYPFLKSVFKLKPDIISNKNQKECLEKLYIASIANISDYHSSNLSEYNKCLEALLINANLYAIISADIVIDNILKISPDNPSLCFSRNDTLSALFSVYLVAHKLRQLNFRFSLIDLQDNQSVKYSNTLSYLYAAICRSLTIDQALIGEIYSRVNNFGCAIVSDAVKKSILNHFDSNACISIQKSQTNLLNCKASNYNLITEPGFVQDLLHDRFSFVKHLSSYISDTLSRVSSCYTAIPNGRVFLACAPIAHTPAMLALGRLLFSKIYLLPHSDIPSYEIPSQMYDYQIIVDRPRLHSDPCGQNPFTLESKELFIDEL